MGADKASLRWNGRSAVARLADVARLSGAGAVVTAGGADHGLPRVDDWVPDAGPVAGIVAGLAALRAAGYARALVLAVDAATLEPQDLAPLFVAPAPGAAYDSLNLPLVMDITAAPKDVGPGWAVGRFIAAVGLARPVAPAEAYERLRGANTPEERETLLAALVATEGPRDHQLFAFESDFVATLRCIPMAVRLKLDRVGIKLSLRQWSRFKRPDRQELLEAPCGSEADLEAYQVRLLELIALRSNEPVKRLSEQPAALGELAGDIPPSVTAFARSVGVPPPTDDAWRELTDLQRFALIKLTRDSHDNINFIPAMREFGLDVAT
jgi:molybdopterin-guanine dinucleotide biosynthesis protein A